MKDDLYEDQSKPEQPDERSGSGSKDKKETARKANGQHGSPAHEADQFHSAAKADEIGKSLTTEEKKAVSEAVPADTVTKPEEAKLSVEERPQETKAPDEKNTAEAEEEPVEVVTTAPVIVKEPEPEPDREANKVDAVLQYAWELYETYSKGASKQKSRGGKIREQIILLIFLTTLLAVSTTLPGMGWVYQRMLYIPGLGWLLTNTGPFILSAALIILSVATSAILSYATQFTPLKAWIMYRVGADDIRQEIYLYRMMAGEYETMERDKQNTRDLFLQRLEAVNKQVYEMETVPPFLQLSNGKPVKYEISAPRRWFKRLTAPVRWVHRLWRSIRGRGGKKPSIATQAASIKVPSSDSDGASSGTTDYPDKLPGRYFPEHDNGFNLLTGEIYCRYRAIPQRDWYVGRVWQDYERIRDWRIILLVMGGVSAVLAAIRLEPYIVITTAAVIAINTHIQLNLIGSNYGNYHVTASRLDAEIVRWRNLPEEERESRENISKFVSTIERVLDEERNVWMQQASQALQETEQALVKGAGRRSQTNPANPTGDGTTPSK